MFLLAVGDVGQPSAFPPPPLAPLGHPPPSTTTTTTTTTGSDVGTFHLDPFTVLHDLLHSPSHVLDYSCGESGDSVSFPRPPLAQ